MTKTSSLTKGWLSQRRGKIKQLGSAFKEDTGKGVGWPITTGYEAAAV